MRGAIDTTDWGNVILTPSLESDVAGRLLEAIAPLENSGKLGAILLRMPPTFGPRNSDLADLEGLLRQFRGGGGSPRRVVLELRHAGWVDPDHREETVAFLQEQGVVLASIDGPPVDTKYSRIMPALDEVTDARLSYLRLHGRDANAYLHGKSIAERFHYDYSDAELDGIMDRAQNLARATDEVHVIFNNNSHDYAPIAAQRLRRKLGQIPTQKAGRLKQATLL